MLAPASITALSGVFFASSIGKLRAVALFREQVADYDLLPYSMTRAAAGCIVMMEFAAAVFLIPSATRGVGMLLAALLLCIFLVAVGSAIARHKIVGCACFGESNRADVVGLHTLVRITLLGVLLLLGWLDRNTALGLDSLVLGGLLLLLVLLVTDLSRLVGPLRSATQQIVNGVVTEPPEG